MFQRGIFALLLLFTLHDSRSYAGALIARIDGRDPAKWQLTSAAPSEFESSGFAALPTGGRYGSWMELVYTFDGGRSWSLGLPALYNSDMARTVAAGRRESASYHPLGFGSVLIADNGTAQILSADDGRAIAKLNGSFFGGGEFTDGSVCFAVADLDAGRPPTFTFMLGGLERDVVEVARLDGAGENLARFYCLLDSVSGAKCVLFETVQREAGELARLSWKLDLESGIIERFNSGRELPAGSVCGESLVAVESGDVVGYALNGGSLNEIWRTELAFNASLMSCSSDGALAAFQRGSEAGGLSDDNVFVLATESGKIIDSFDPHVECSGCPIVFDRKHRLHLVSPEGLFDLVYAIGAQQDEED